MWFLFQPCNVAFRSGDMIALSICCSSEASLPNGLSDFYTWFEAQNDIPMRKSTLPPVNHVLCLFKVDVRRTLSRVNPQTARQDLFCMTEAFMVTHINLAGHTNFMELPNWQYNICLACQFKCSRRRDLYCLSGVALG